MAFYFNIHYKEHFSKLNRPVVACKTSGIFNYVMSLLDYYVAPPTNTFPMGKNSSSQLNLWLCSSFIKYFYYNETVKN